MKSTQHRRATRILRNAEDDGNFIAECGRNGKRGGEAFVAQYINLVKSIANHYSGKCLTQEDLIQEGIIGLLLARDRYEAGRGNRFSTYATYWIRQTIVRALEKQDRVIRLPAYIREAGVADCVFSLDNPVCREEDTLYLELLVDTQAVPVPEIVEATLRKEMINRLLGILTPIERRVLVERYGLDGKPPRTLTEVALGTRYTREGIRHIQIRAIRKLRAVATNSSLLQPVG